MINTYSISRIIDGIQLPVREDSDLYFSKIIRIDFPTPELNKHLETLQNKYDVASFGDGATFGVLNDTPAIIVETFTEEQIDGTWKATATINTIPRSCLSLKELTKVNPTLDGSTDKMITKLKELCGKYIQDDDIVIEEYRGEKYQILLVTLKSPLNTDLDGFFNELSIHPNIIVCDEFTEYIEKRTLLFIETLKEFRFLQELNENDNKTLDVVAFFEKKKH